ncbi:protease modulator HflK [Aliidongia dinghuensis]|uniref:Protein HflK n=1 Tax=Aliidongia dinghuensis TaxID=1867774 RepID=A0A8J2Z1D0_9PROT|nr:FtsH protease activity modulator HflK [Aliidongia dinghuensis]GGF48513.1 protease modulator HflK [Aliidongia dinghuensis]
MPWNGQGGGGGGPWGGNGGPGPWGKAPSGGGKGKGPQPPNLDELLRRGQDRLRGLVPGTDNGGGRLAAIVAAVLVGLWLITGFYRVNPDEEGVVLRFGAYADTTGPGLHYHLPAPIESVEKPKVTRVNRTEVGVSTEPLGRGVGRQALPEESLMLTGDENIVDINFSVFWVIKDAKAYLFNVRNPEATVKSAAEAAIREVVGHTPIASVLAEGRRQVETDTEALLQNILDGYAAGLQVTQVQLQKVDPPQPVIEAYRDVQKARADQERLKNEAEAYQNSIVPLARGDAEQKIQNAQAYKQEVVARAQGDAQRFLSVLSAYQVSKEVTAERLYLETMEDVLKNAHKVVIDRQAQGIVPYLPLPGLTDKQPTPLPAPPGQPSASQSKAGKP